MSVSDTDSAVRVIQRFSAFLASPGVAAGSLARVDRPLLERYLADLHHELGGKKEHTRHISALNVFFRAIRQHGWDPALPGGAVFYPEDYPRQPEQLPRALADHVMAQLEQPGNLDRWDNPAYRLITLILMRCGLRISDALKLPFACVVTDSDGAPYLRYSNHKMKREALVPIDDELQAEISSQQQRVLQRWPDGAPVLLPRPNMNLGGHQPIAANTYRDALSRWLERCDIRDEHGQLVHLTPHQLRHPRRARPARPSHSAPVAAHLRHTAGEPGRSPGSHPDPAGPRINRNDRLLRQDQRRDGPPDPGENGTRVNINGDRVTIGPDGPLAQAQWAKTRYGMATQTLPNGWCGLPIQKRCPHANACLTCPGSPPAPSSCPSCANSAAARSP